MSQARRSRMFEVLHGAAGPVTGGELAGRLGVSRQIIVQDVAVLRAGGADIVATPRGYVLNTKAGHAPHRDLLAAVHTREQIEDELNILVDHGVKVIDVIVEHPVYGELRGLLMIETREDVRDLLERLRGSEPLSTLTRGVHLHTVEAQRPESIARAREKLAAKGYLLGESAGAAVADPVGH